MNPKPILLVEDNAQDEMLILRALARVHLANQVMVARDGQQALDLLLDPERDLPTVVMLDLGLPRIGGLEVLARLRDESRTRLLPVAILTSSDEEEDRLRSYRGGANSFVRKPVDFGSFAETVGRMGVYWALINNGIQERP